MVPSLSGGASGYMPMKGQFGFVKISGNPAHTIAHELGHGAFRLWHTFSTNKDAIYIAAQGATDNLMDYSNGTGLYKHQWDLVHDPQTMLFPSSVDEDETLEIGETLPTLDLSNYTGYAFLTPSGEAIVIKNIQAGQFNYDGGLLNFSLNDGTQVKGVFVSNPEKFIGYYQSSVLSLFPIDYGIRKSQLRSSEMESRLKQHVFSDYYFAASNHPVIAYARTKINQTYADCTCKYNWVNLSKADEIREIVELPIIPSGAMRSECEGNCDATVYIEKYKIQEGLGVSVFEFLFDTTPADQVEELAKLSRWLSFMTKDKKFGFYCLKYRDSRDIKDFIKLLKENDIRSQQKFDEAFHVISCRDFEVVFSEVDLWKGVHQQSYNTYSVDYVSRLRGVQEPYRYSLTDLITRDHHVRIHQTLFAPVILDAEKAGQAQAIAMSEGERQYNAMFGTTSAIFAWGSYFANTMSIVMEVGVATEVIRYTGTLLTAGKSSKSSWLQKILSGIKKLINPNAIDGLIGKIDDVKLREFVRALKQNDNILLKESNSAKGRLGIFAQDGDIITEIGHVDGNTLWISEVRQMDNLPSNATVTKIEGVDIKMLRGESDGAYELVVRETGECFVRRMTVPTLLIEGKNIFRGYASDYSKAKNIFDQFRENYTYELRKVFSGDQLAERIEAFDKRNLAYFEGQIDNIKLNSSDVKISGNTYTGEKIFDAYKVDKYGNVNSEAAWSREFDTEYVGLSEIAQKLGGKKGQVLKNVKGDIYVASELPYCISCQGVIQDFANMFPNVNIFLIDGLKSVK
jgi:hypothetical protein